MSSRRRGFVLPLGVLAALALAAIGAPLVAPADPLAIDATRILEAPSPAHPLGTDGLGRDVLARLLYGARASLAAGFVATLAAFALGAGLGLAAGLSSSLTDGLLARSADALAAFPYLVGCLAVLGLLDARLAAIPPALRVGLAIGLFSWPLIFRVVRAEAGRLASSELVLAARAAGAGRLRVALVHVAPAALAPAIAPAAFLAAGAVLAESGLSFLGLGITPPAPSWGNQLREAMEHVRQAWWLAFFPGVALYLATAACQGLGEALRLLLSEGAPTGRV